MRCLADVGRLPANLVFVRFESNAFSKYLVPCSFLVCLSVCIGREQEQAQIRTTSKPRPAETGLWKWLCLHTWCPGHSLTRHSEMTFCNGPNGTGDFGNRLVARFSLRLSCKGTPRLKRMLLICWSILHCNFCHHAAEFVIRCWVSEDTGPQKRLGCSPCGMSWYRNVSDIVHALRGPQLECQHLLGKSCGRKSLGGKQTCKTLSDGP